MQWYGNRGKMYKTVQINCFTKCVLHDCISMCFDICTMNIRVSIRVRGLHLVWCYYSGVSRNQPSLAQTSNQESPQSDLVQCHIADTLTLSNTVNTLHNALMCCQRVVNPQNLNWALRIHRGSAKVCQQWNATNALRSEWSESLWSGSGLSDRRITVFSF